VPLPDAFRDAIVWVAAAAFAVAQIALLFSTLRRPAPESRPAVRGRLGRGVDAAMLLVPAALTTALLILAWHAARASSP